MLRRLFSKEYGHYSKAIYAALLFGLITLIFAPIERYYSDGGLLIYFGTLFMVLGVGIFWINSSDMFVLRRMMRQIKASPLEYESGTRKESELRDEYFKMNAAYVQGMKEYCLAGFVSVTVLNIVILPFLRYTIEWMIPLF